MAVSSRKLLRQDGLTKLQPLIMAVHVCLRLRFCVYLCVPQASRYQKRTKAFLASDVALVSCFVVGVAFPPAAVVTLPVALAVSGVRSVYGM